MEHEKTWETSYKGHTLRVENSFSTERLFVDNELQDELFGFGFRSVLFGKFRDGDNAGAEVKVSLGGWWRVHCRIFVDNYLVFHSKPDDTTAAEIIRNASRKGVIVING